MTKKEEATPFKKISEIEYEVQVGGRTKLIRVPFGKTEALFRDFISNGGIIDPVTGQVQTDILSLISSFKDVGNTLLTEFDDNGKVVTEGNCSTLGTTEVIALFQLATHVIENFIKGLTAIQKSQLSEVPDKNEEK